MKLKLAIAVVVGAILGAVITLTLIVRNSARAFANQYLLAVMDQVNVVLHISAGRERDLLEQIEQRLPEYADTIDRLFRNHPDSTNALWMIRAYYERNRIPVPGAIRGILDALPEKPPTACRARLEALDRGKTKGPDSEPAGSSSP